LKATSNLDAVLSATQLGITLASLGLGWVGEPFLAKRIAPLLAQVGVTDPAAVSSIAFASAFALITFFHIVLGELAPKSLAIQRARNVSLWTAPPLLVFYTLLYPFIWTLNHAAALLLRLVGIDNPDNDSDTGGQRHSFTDDELEYVFSHATKLSPRTAFTNRLMVQVLRGSRTTAKQIMIPRDKVAVMEMDNGIKENLHTAGEGGYSRFPVVTNKEENKVLGLLLIREWLWQIKYGGECDFAGIIRKIVEFDEKTTVPEMIERFRAMRCHMAVVYDGEKKFTGMLTFEDVLEEIIGDIRDETDIESGFVFARGHDNIEIHGEMPLRELQAETGWAFDASPLETVSSWIRRHLDTPPRKNETLRIGEFHITIKDTNSEKILRTLVRYTPEESPNNTPSEKKE
ncbi:MAG: hemolysin family protein, partial [Puniceicoccales bacterium]|nr:hemolysin family protein [Puniceicoccales bacterium]